MHLLPPETEAHRRHRQVWDEIRAWYAWQERVEFVYGNGERRLGSPALPLMGCCRGIIGLLPPSPLTAV